LLIFDNVFGVGLFFLMISITSICWVNKEISKYQSENKNEDANLILSRIPLEKLLFIKNLTLTSMPLIFVGFFAIIYAFSI
jgi:hypothetical protein